jgi:hypothetical protein
MLKFKEGFTNNYQNYGAAPLLVNLMWLSFTQVPPGIHLPKLPTLRHAARACPVGKHSPLWRPWVWCQTFPGMKCRFVRVP